MPGFGLQPMSDDSCTILILVILFFCTKFATPQPPIITHLDATANATQPITDTIVVPGTPSCLKNNSFCTLRIAANF